jgi:hypothetical protein
VTEVKEHMTIDEWIEYTRVRGYCLTPIPIQRVDPPMTWKSVAIFWSKALSAIAIFLIGMLLTAKVVEHFAPCAAPLDTEQGDDA